MCHKYIILNADQPLPPKVKPKIKTKLNKRKYLGFQPLFYLPSSNIYLALIRTTLFLDLWKSNFPLCLPHTYVQFLSLSSCSSLGNSIQRQSRLQYWFSYPAFSPLTRCACLLCHGFVVSFHREVDLSHLLCQCC